MSTWSQYEGEAIPRRIFVGGIDPTTTETDLKILFEVLRTLCLVISTFLCRISRPTVRLVGLLDQHNTMNI